VIDAQTYLEHVRRDGERISAVAAGHLDDPVPSCPGMSVGQLVAHTAELCRWMASIVKDGQPVAPQTPEAGPDVLVRHDEHLATLLDGLASADPDAACWAWGTDQHVRFWIRRVAQELTIHRWDVENAVTEPLPLDPTVAADGIDEYFLEFAPNNPFFEGAGAKFAGDGETISLAATDLDRTWTAVARPDCFELVADRAPDVTAKGTASDLLLFIWGRKGPDALDVSGDGSLLDRWQERVKI
jgi:uncharacterized protein (TIGR03083 family)